jgi:hypothetical protein
MNGVMDGVAKRNQLGNWATTETLPTAVTAKKTKPFLWENNSSAFCIYRYEVGAVS